MARFVGFLALASSLALPLISAAGSAKRGFVADGCTGPSCQDVALLGDSIGWYYAYNPQDPYASSSGSGGFPELFVPMHWCFTGLNASLPSGVNSTYLLGFNEPNNLHNCNKSPEQAAVAWATVLQRWGDGSTQLVSPATAGNGIPWLDQFFGNCTALYGKKGCQLSHVAVHDYSCTASSTMSYLKSIYDRYNLPVWLTEFSCGDGAAAKPMAQHLAFMKEIVPLLDAAPYVYRYSWMSANGGQRALFEGTPPSMGLSPVGQLYKDL